MEKAICISDLHIMWDTPVARLDDIVATEFLKLGFVFEYARKEKASILQAGDFFDSPRGYYLLNAIIQFLSSYSDVKVYCVAGQHDQYLKSNKGLGATNLGVLSSVGMTPIVEYSKVGSLHVYGANYGVEAPEPKELGGVNVLLIHKMIAASKLWSDQENVEYAPQFLREHPGYDLIVCGDCHRKFHFSHEHRHIINTGPMLRFTAEKYNFEHSPGFYVYNVDSMNVRWVGIPHRPAEEVLSREHLERQEAINASMQEFIEEVEKIKDSEDFVGGTFFDSLERLMASDGVSDKIREMLHAEIDEEARR